MRTKFCAYFPEKLEEYECFLPESAMDTVFSSGITDPFDISDFEKLICELSHAVVIFPEAPGSFAETGYFSAISEIAKICILVLNSEYQDTDSFISLGPAKKIAHHSKFHPVIQISYNHPDFDPIAERIKRYKYTYRKNLEIEKYKDLSPYEILCIIYLIVDILSVATMDDIIFFFRAIFQNRFSDPTVRKITAVLIGSHHLTVKGEYGHFSANKDKTKLVEVRNGKKSETQSIKLELANLYQNGDADFLDVLESVKNVA